MPRALMIFQSRSHWYRVRTRSDRAQRQTWPGATVPWTYNGDCTAAPAWAGRPRLTRAFLRHCDQTHGACSAQASVLRTKSTIPASGCTLSSAC